MALPDRSSSTEAGRTVMSEAAKVVAVIRKAFGGVPRGRLTLHEAEAIAFYAYKSEQALARKRDRERRWEEVPDSSLEECAAALTFLDPVSWRYYLPAYMVWFLGSSRSDPGSMAAFTLMYELGLHPPEVEHRIEKFGVLDRNQGAAVLAFLRLVAEDDSYGSTREAAKAIDCHWIKYLTV